MIGHDWYPEDAARRGLPAGYDDPDSPFALPAMFRTHYQCVSIDCALVTGNRIVDHDIIATAAAEWAYADHVRRHGPGVIPD